MPVCLLLGLCGFSATMQLLLAGEVAEAVEAEWTVGGSATVIKFFEEKLL